MESIEYYVYIIDIIVAAILLYYFSHYFLELVKWKSIMQDLSYAVELNKCIIIADVYNSCNGYFPGLVVLNGSYGYTINIAFPLNVKAYGNFKDNYECKKSIKKEVIICEAKQ